MLNLNALEKLPQGLRLDYEVAHSTPGREGTKLTADLSLFVRSDKAWCDMKIEGCSGADAKEALDRMVVWLRRLADGIEERKTLEIPFG